MCRSVFVCVYVQLTMDGRERSEGLADIQYGIILQPVNAGRLSDWSWRGENIWWFDNDPRYCSILIPRQVWLHAS